MDPKLEGPCWGMLCTVAPLVWTVPQVRCHKNAVALIGTVQTYNKGSKGFDTVEPTDLNKPPQENRRIVLEDIIPRFTKIEEEVVKELQKFIEKSGFSNEKFFTLDWHTHLPINSALPDLVAEEEERATTHYLALTTIATFFSSITATTLQFTYNSDDRTTIMNIVNLAWFVSLVFSISSGVNGVLSMTWRKSIVWVCRSAIFHSQLDH